MMLASAVATLLLALAGASPVTVTTVDPPTDLAGGWRCAVGDDPGFAAPDLDDSAWKPIVLPDSERVCVGAVVWLRRAVTIDEAHRGAPLGIAMGIVDGAHDVYVDGVRIGGDGDVDAHVSPIHRGQAFAIPKEAVGRGAFVVAVRIGNDPALFDADPSRRLVPDGPLMIGRMPGVNEQAAAVVERAITERSLGFLAMSLVFSFIALYHVLLWFLRRDLVGYLWFGLTGILVTTWLAITELRSTTWLPIDGVTAGVVGNFFGTLVNASFIEFVWRFVQRKPPTKPWRAYQAVLVAIAFVGFIPKVGLALSVSVPVILCKIMMPVAGLILVIRWTMKGSRDARILLVGFLIGAIAAPAEVYVLNQGVKLPVSPADVSFLCFMIVMAVALAAQFTRTLKDVDEKNRELRDTNASIARFVPFGFLDALGKRTVSEVQRGDAQVREMAVMFCDLRGFTTLAESLGPQETFRFINDYLARMEPEVYRGAGFINQYLGDGIMALFPSQEGPQPRSGADGAVTGAIGMCRALDKLNDARTKAGLAPVRIGIGVHIGRLMIGTIGGGEQLDGGVIGDCVNASARLEGMTKMYATNLLISGDVVAKLDGVRPVLRHLDTVMAKGKTESMAIYEVLDVDPSRDIKASTLEFFTDAQRQYRAGAFKEALAMFERVLAIDPNDGAARLLRERCHTLMTYPPEAWNGVYAMSAK